MTNHFQIVNREPVCFEAFLERRHCGIIESVDVIDLNTAV
jgi:hypothetical protein